REDRDKAGREQHPNFVEADLAVAFGRCLSQLAENHQLGERRYVDRPPDLGPVPDSIDQRRREVERQAFVAALMIVRANVFVAGMTDQDRPGYQLTGPTLGTATKAPLAHIGDREAGVLLDKRSVLGPGFAPVVVHRD